jgi:hypothetical protein
VWELVHASRYSKLAPILTNLIPGLESAARNAEPDELRHESRGLLADTYQAVAAIMSKLGEQDAAWVAADRAGFAAEAIGEPLMVAASMFRMAHVFLSLGEIAQRGRSHCPLAALCSQWPITNLPQKPSRCMEHFI